MATVDRGLADVLPRRAGVVERSPATSKGRSAEEAQREADRKKREVAQRVARDRKRLEEFGQEGIKLLRVADAAVKRILSTEAAQAGSLGELDFRAELVTLEETLRRATTIRNVMAESWAIPGPSQDDLELYKDARRTLRRLVRQFGPRTSGASFAMR